MIGVFHLQRRSCDSRLEFEAKLLQTLAHLISELYLNSIHASHLQELSIMRCFKPYFLRYALSSKLTAFFLLSLKNVNCAVCLGVEKIKGNAARLCFRGLSLPII